MPRTARIDAPGALHHVIVCGIARQAIFRDDRDRARLLDRLAALLEESGSACYAWALIPNHFHLLLRTGRLPLAQVMRRLLTGYAMAFNGRYRRAGHVFQNRYKSILCQEEPYLLELVRYIHLNPVRAGLVPDKEGLDGYAYTGHSTIMGRHERPWQDTAFVLLHFGRRLGRARQRYREFVLQGIALGQRPDLIGGGLVRSAGGWSMVNVRRRAGAAMKGDERILGDSDFVVRVLAEAEEDLVRRHRRRARGVDLEQVGRRVAEVMEVSAAGVYAPGKQRRRVQARSLLCYWAVRELGYSMTAVAERLGISAAAVSQSVARGEQIAKEMGTDL
jgi:putative transposase